MSSSTEKAFQIIDFIAAHQGKAKQVDISRQLKINKATLHRYLKTLINKRIIEKKENVFFLGLELVRLGNLVKSESIIIDQIVPPLKKIVREINETINIARFKEEKLTYVQRLPSKRSLQLKANIGDHLPLHCTALGKAVLSILPPVISSQLITQAPLKSYTSNTITEFKAVQKEIEKTKDKGYSIEQCEFEEGLSCGAIPLHIENLNFTGAVSFSGTSSRLSESKIINIIHKIQPVMDEITKQLSQP